MKRLLIAGAVALLLSSTTQAATYLPVDKVFVKQAEELGVSQTVWDQPEYAAVTFPSAYKFTTHYRISRGLLGAKEAVLTPQEWTATNSLDLTKLKGMDVDVKSLFIHVPLFSVMGFPFQSKIVHLVLQMLWPAELVSSER